VTDETEALRAEVAELRAEIERLQAWQATHVCQPQAGNWPSQCTCGTSTRCPVHVPPPWQGTWTSTIRPWTSVAAGAAGGGSTHMWTVNTAATPMVTIAPLTTMGAAPQPRIFTYYDVGGECA
jgi:hypothetical protein